MNQKLPPYDNDAEEAVIGSLIIDPEAIFKVATFLQPQDFYRESNRWAYEGCLALYQRNEAINQITLAQELAIKDKLEPVGGTAALAHLVSIVPTSLHIDYYGRIVHRLAVMRRLIEAAGQIAALGYEAGPDADSTLSEAENLLFQLRQRQSQRDFVPLRQLLDQYIEESPLQAAPQGERIPHVLTGYSKLDELLGGLQRSDLVILGARPSMGKSSLALGIARNAALHQKARVAIFSLEMSREAVVQRLISMQAGVDSHRLRLGNLTDADERRVMDAVGVLAEAPIFLDDSPQIRVVEMRSKARRLYYESSIDLIVVDYLQLVQGTGRPENRVQEISEISRSLKALARELSVPVLSVSQLSRAADVRPDHRPQLSDLRDSGSIEQDADVVLFIYRDEFYYDEEEWKEKNLGEPYPKGIAEVEIAKHRNGPPGKISLRFVPRFASFEDLPQEEQVFL